MIWVNLLQSLPSIHQKKQRLGSNPQHIALKLVIVYELDSINGTINQIFQQNVPTFTGRLSTTFFICLAIKRISPTIPIPPNILKWKVTEWLWRYPSITSPKNKQPKMI